MEKQKKDTYNKKRKLEAEMREKKEKSIYENEKESSFNFVIGNNDYVFVTG
jgi:hypothetical protein